ncbi:MAG: FecR domain-containing protein [Polyangiaceae bacterium]
MKRTESPDPRRLGALTELLGGAVEPPTAAQLDQGLSRIRARVLGRTRSRINVRLALLAAALLVCTLLGVVLVPRFLARSSVPLPVAVTRVDGGRIIEGGYLSEVGDAGVTLLFNEGSRFALAPGTRGRLQAVTAAGARLTLDYGTASFRITPNLDHRWWVEAGPFLVSVRGTDFTVIWDPTSEQFAVKLRQGRVAVSGPLLGEELILRPGQNLSVNLPKGQTVITDGRAEKLRPPADSLAAPLATASTSLANPAAQAPSAQSSASVRAGSERQWGTAVAKGEWDRILADVERAGVEASLRSLSSDELFALADAARYRRRPDLARSALLTQRQRFPNSPRASDAVFLLGRVEELRPGAEVTAIKRYDEYLARAPSGTYAAEALGRKMILVKDLRGADGAREVATQYLKRFPHGSYADAARSLEPAP